MKLVIIGIQGSGKGTQSKLISEHYKLKHISTGDLIREEIKMKSEIGRKFEGLINQGKLAPDEIVNKLLEKNIPKDNWLLDGYPRNLEQAKLLEKFGVDKVIFLKLSTSEVISRLANRFYCKICKEAYGLNNMPKTLGTCNLCGGNLYQRDDDKIGAIKARIEVFKKETLPLLDYYKDKGIIINANQSVEKVFSEIKEKLE
jgi:adenylate kinase